MLRYELEMYIQTFHNRYLEYNNQFYSKNVGYMKDKNDQTTRYEISKDRYTRFHEN